ncbi:hypothetical protein HBI25_164400 [Parastagonospora nodorum]|nr:hypothetical protein HBH50_034830 [Parastagonospora nodorum]KAH4097232.1 hypothetical protein HBH48_043700 [Parastagonospora nodorum]KAH4431303.1 hypothetical protein HBH93_149990 [Parastagonospora nodorum]KAH4462250.1 hypothetical protein HBH91_061640 [Parastagonospora nodorum]KAH4513924.1 hypothetical protein HBH89_032630 [Parastagonospora nodorum]
MRGCSRSTHITYPAVEVLFISKASSDIVACIRRNKSQKPDSTYKRSIPSLSHMRAKVESCSRTCLTFLSRPWFDLRKIRFDKASCEMHAVASGTLSERSASITTVTFCLV